MKTVSIVDLERIDPAIRCDACEAVCCRLKVVLQPGDDAVPRRFIDHDERGMAVMAKSEEGWCAALDLRRMCCSIYELRPAICREFRMGGEDCRDERAAWRSKPASAF